MTSYLPEVLELVLSNPVTSSLQGLMALLASSFKWNDILRLMSLADLGPPYGPKFSRFHTVFLEKFINSYVGAPLDGWSCTKMWILLTLCVNLIVILWEHKSRYACHSENQCVNSRYHWVIQNNLMLHTSQGGYIMSYWHTSQAGYTMSYRHISQAGYIMSYWHTSQAGYTMSYRHISQAGYTMSYLHRSQAGYTMSYWHRSQGGYTMSYWHTSQGGYTMPYWHRTQGGYTMSYWHTSHGGYTMSYWHTS